MKQISENNIKRVIAALRDEYSSAIDASDSIAVVDYLPTAYDEKLCNKLYILKTEYNEYIRRTQSNNSNDPSEQPETLQPAAPDTNENGLEPEPEPELPELPSDLAPGDMPSYVYQGFIGMQSGGDPFYMYWKEIFNTNDTFVSSYYYSQDKETFALKSALSEVATSGLYEDLTNKPTFKTINGISLVGDGDITIKGGETETIVSKNLFDPNAEGIIDGKYLSREGTYLDNANYFITDYIPFDSDLLISSGYGSANNGGAFSCTYNAAKQLVQSYLNSQTGGILTKEDENTKYARFSILKNGANKYQVERGNLITEYAEYVRPFNKNERLKDFSKTLETCSALTEFTTFPYHIKKNCTYSLYCEFSSFSLIDFGKGYDKYRGTWVSVTSSSINLMHKESSISTEQTVNHGLTIQDYLKIIMYTDLSGALTIILNTNGGNYKTKIDNFGYEANYALFVKPSSTISNVTVTAGCSDLVKPIWMFGDSYYGVDNARVIGALKNFGVFNFMLNGLAGLGSEGAYTDLVKCLSYYHPEYLVWSLGMNDSDTTYSLYLAQVQTLQALYGFKLILTTIPTVPDRDKTNINNAVKNTNYKYIDAYKAVINGSSWYSGYLSSDNIHPTATGANAIAAQFLVDFPELLTLGVESSSDSIDGKLDKLTIALLNAVNSGITSTKVTTYDSYNTLISNKVDKVSGKQLSTNDYTTAEKSKLSSLQFGGTSESDQSLRIGEAGSYSVSSIAKNNAVSVRLEDGDAYYAELKCVEGGELTLTDGDNNTIRLVGGMGEASITMDGEDVSFTVNGEDILDKFNDYDYKTNNLYLTTTSDSKQKLVVGSKTEDYAHVAIETTDSTHASLIISDEQGGSIELKCDNGEASILVGEENIVEKINAHDTKLNAIKDFTIGEGLKVEDGVLKCSFIPAKYYTGSTLPNNDTGNNGDLYLLIN